MRASRTIAALIAVAALGGAFAAALTAPALPAAPASKPHVAAAARPRAFPPPAMPYAAQFPDGPGRLIAERACAICHSPMLVTQQAKDSAGWEKTLATMEKWGAPVSGADHDTLRVYLLSHFGPKSR